MAEMSPADVMAMANADGFNGNNMYSFFILFLLLSGGYGGFGGWNRGNYGNYATKDDISEAFNFNQLDNGIRATQNGLCDLGYTTNMNLAGGFAGVDKAIFENTFGITKAIGESNYATNMNIVNSAHMTNDEVRGGFANVTAQINELSHQMKDCCCDLKSQMLQDKYDAVKDQLVQAQGIIANTAQTQNILNSLGTYYPNPPYSRGGCNY